MDILFLYDMDNLIFALMIAENFILTLTADELILTLMPNIRQLLADGFQL